MRRLPRPRPPMRAVRHPVLPPPQVDRSRRHLDAGVASRFWSLVDQDIFVRKPYLLPKGVSNVPAAPQAGGAAATGASATA